MIRKLVRWFKRGKRPVIPEIQPWGSNEISPEVRMKLRQWLDNPDTQLALSIVQTGRPTVFMTGGLHVEQNNVELYQAKVLSQYHMMRGWEACLRAILGLRYEKPEYVEPRETFPEQNEEI